jgi:integrase/recombinase XerD
MDRMHVYFDGDGRPFILDSQMRWWTAPNAFLTHVGLVSAKTSSTRTWRSYAYQFGDWLSFCERIGVEWRHATELNIATYRNILVVEPSRLTGRALKRSSINHKLTVICQFYRFAQKKGWIEALPFDRIPRMGPVSFAPQARLGPGSSLRLAEAAEELGIPPRRDVRYFIKSFQRWRDQLIAEIMWLTGMRCSEVCSLPLHALPEDPATIEKETVTIKIIGKGQKRRAVLLPVRLLRSVDRCVHMERRQQVSAGAEDCSNVFVGRCGKPLQTPAVNRVFSTNCKRTGLKISPHLLRHYAGFRTIRGEFVLGPPDGSFVNIFPA